MAQNKSSSKMGTSVWLFISKCTCMQVLPVKVGADPLDLLPSTLCTRCSQLYELVLGTVYE